MDHSFFHIFNCHVRGFLFLLNVDDSYKLLTMDDSTLESRKDAANREMQCDLRTLVNH